jgi:hypothetical protein
MFTLNWRRIPLVNYGIIRFYLGYCVMDGDDGEDEKKHLHFGYSLYILIPN